jgi:hypothetical protein
VAPGEGSNMICHRVLSAGALLVCALGAACARDEPAARTPAHLVTGPSAALAAPGASAAAGEIAGVIAFPPRNEPYRFRQDLEWKYRDGLGRSPSSTYVDLEGDIVWTQEYLRYRVNQCDHATAAQKVFDQIDGRGVAPVCGSPPSGAVVAFPPRNEPYAFRQELERKYRDGLGRSPTATYVDIEGAIVWTQEYLRYRVNRCGHTAATGNVLTQVDGGGVPPVCGSGPDGVWDGYAPTYWNSPFTADIALRGTELVGTYKDKGDAGYVWGTYTGGNAIVINVTFADAGLVFSGAFDGRDKIKGTMRAYYVTGVFPFSMIRRP